MKLPPDFREMLEEFAREEVDCVVIGGYAFAFHAEPRATKDLDLLIAGSPENRTRAARAVARFGAPTHVVDALRALAPDEIVYLGRPPLRIDFLRSIDGVDTDEVLRRSVATSWDEVPVRIISIEDLIANKRAAGRLQDLADVERLERGMKKSSR